MKKVYIPTKEELENLERLGVNTYYYLITKTIESMIMADVIYEEEDMFEVAYDEFSDIPQIIYAIARMYPERIIDSEQASSDIKLCQKIIPTLIQQNKSIYGLDQMNYFKKEVLQNPKVLRVIINTLTSHLQNSPRYRYEYDGPNDTLDQIFSGEIETKNMDSTTFKNLSIIDPIYLTRKEGRIILPEVAARTIAQYANTYGVEAYGVRETYLTSLNNQNETAKRLIRKLNEHKKYYN